MLNDIEDVENRREEVIKKKFTDPNFVSSQFNIMLDVVAKRNKCKKKFGQFKIKLRDLRNTLSDMNAEHIFQTMEARVSKLVKDIKGMEEESDKTHNFDIQSEDIRKYK